MPRYNNSKKASILPIAATLDQNKKRILLSSEDKESKPLHGRTQRKRIIRRTSTRKPSNKSQSKYNNCNGIDKRKALQHNQNNSATKLAANESNRYVTERESTSIPRNHLYNTTSTVIQQQNMKNILNCPKSPTEASIAPTCYNGALNDSKNDFVIIATNTRSNDDSPHVISDRSTSTSNASTAFPKPSSSRNQMSIIFTTNSLSSNPTEQTKKISQSSENRPIYKSQCRAATTSMPNVTKCLQPESELQQPPSSSLPPRSPPPLPPPHPSIPPSRYSYGSSHEFSANSSIYRERSIEETEAAHDLLSLSQSLPPLPAPCVVTILHPIANYAVNSADVHEITPKKEYITYNSNDSISSTVQLDDNTHSNRNGIQRNRYESIKCANISAPNRSVANGKTIDLKSQITPLTPPTSDSSSSSSDIELVIDTTPTVKRPKHSTQSLHGKRGGEHERNRQNSKSKSAQVIGMTIFDSVMINDGRSKRNNADAEVIHINEKRKGRYKCPQCGKQYATSSNLSRHKQTHRSLDSQSAKKCNTCGKAYVSMPALAMHLLTHKLTHSCDVCGKLFSRPWLLQGHLRSHTGEKPYGCAHCGKAFADRSNLRAHMQTHSVNKQYECTRCRKTFALKSYLNKHLDSSCLRDEFKRSYEPKRNQVGTSEQTVNRNNSGNNSTRASVRPKKTGNDLGKAANGENRQQIEFENYDGNEADDDYDDEDEDEDEDEDDEYIIVT